MILDIEVSGLDQLGDKLQALGVTLSEAAGDALRAEAELEMTEAKLRTPVMTGALRESGHVTGPEKDDDDWVVVMAFGGAAADYAIYVHENLEAFHPVGQAKFLESVLVESAPYFPRRVAERLGQVLG